MFTNNSKIIYIYRVFDNFVSVIKNVKPFKKMAYYIYLWLIINLWALQERFLRQKITRRKILNHQFHFSSFTGFAALFQEIFFYQTYDFETDNPQPVILDCGANIGLASLYFKLKYPQSQIICFEPAQTTFGFLKSNLGVFDDMKFARVGLSNRSGQGYLYHFDTLWDMNSSTHKNLYRELRCTKEAIRLVKLSEYTKKLKTIDFLKLDIEGDEEKVLRELEAARQLSKIKKMVMEFHYHSGNSLAQTLSILEKNGFRTIATGGTRPPFRYRKNLTYCLFVFAER